MLICPLYGVAHLYVPVHLLPQVRPVGAFGDQFPPELRQCRKYPKEQPPFRGRRCRVDLRSRTGQGFQANDALATIVKLTEATANAGFPSSVKKP